MLTLLCCHFFFAVILKVLKDQHMNGICRCVHVYMAFAFSTGLITAQ